MGLKSKRKCRPKAAYKPGPEKQIQNAIQSLLLAHRILHFRMNTGFLQSKAGNWVRFGSIGMADLLAFPSVPYLVGNGQYLVVGDTSISAAMRTVRPLWVEVKAGKNTQKPDQVSFQKIVESEGHAYILARSVDDVIKWLKENGVIR